MLTRFEPDVGERDYSVRRRRILVLSPRDPYPVIGGDRVRIHRIARELARHYELTLLTFCETARERDALGSEVLVTRSHQLFLLAPPYLLGLVTGMRIAEF